jgi:hypothetical protein
MTYHSSYNGSHEALVHSDFVWRVGIFCMICTLRCSPPPSLFPPQSLMHDLRIKITMNYKFIFLARLIINCLPNICVNRNILLNVYMVHTAHHVCHFLRFFGEKFCDRNLEHAKPIFHILEMIKNNIVLLHY